MKEFLRKIGSASFIRYFFVGIATSLLDFSLFTLLAVGLQVQIVIANVISTLITISISYLINQSFVFQAEKSGWKRFFQFAGWTLFTGLVVQSVIIWLVVNGGSALAGQFCEPGRLVGDLGVYCDLGVAEIFKPLGKICAMAVGAFANYFGYRFLFRARA